jgi:ribonuclease PH
MPRPDGRQPGDLRPVSFQRGFTSRAPGSVLASFGNTRVLCTAMATDGVPPFLQGKGRGWLTAEYSMLPSSTEQRKPRDKSGTRRALDRDPAPDLAIAARRDGPHADDRAHDLDRLRRDPGGRRDADVRDQRGVGRAPRSPDGDGRSRVLRGWPLKDQSRPCRSASSAR